MFSIIPKFTRLPRETETITPPRVLLASLCHPWSHSLRAARSHGLPLVIAALALMIAPQVTPQENHVANPSFEEGPPGDIPTSWHWWGSDSGEEADDERFEWELGGQSGERSISIREEGWGSRGFWCTALRDIQPRQWYCVSLWAKRDRSTGWLPELQVFGQTRTINLYRVGSWERFDWLMNSGDCEGEVLLKLINQRKPYKVWFDTVTVERLWITPENRGPEGELRWSHSETSVPVVFQVELAGTEAFDETIVLGKTLRNSIPAPPDALNRKRFWRVKAFHNDILLASSAARSIDAEKGTYAPSSPHKQEVLPPLRPASSRYIAFDERGNLIVDGSPLFPIGIYSLPPEKFAEAKRAGFNTVMTIEVDAACRAGLRAMVPRGFRYKGKPGQSADKLPLHELNRWILARYLWDEPAQNNASAYEVFEAHAREKANDPHHPTAIVVYRPENFWSYSSAADILMTDPYPVPHRPLSTVSECVRAAREAVDDRKPIWAVIQAFNWAEASQEARRTGWARWPTYREERCMAYLAIINGAKGILFFRYGGEGKHDQANWRALKRVARELKEVSPILLSESPAIPVSLTAQPSKADTSNRIEFTLKSHGDCLYLIAANNWPGRREATFCFNTNLHGVVNVLSERRRIVPDGAGFSDTFAPHAVHVYKFRLQRAARLHAQPVPSHKKGEEE